MCARCCAPRATGTFALVLGMWYHYLSQSQARARAARSTVGALYYAPAVHTGTPRCEREEERERERASSGVYILRDVPRIYPYYTRRLEGELRCFPERARDIATETETVFPLHPPFRPTCYRGKLSRKMKRVEKQRETITRDLSVRPQSTGLACGCPARITFIREIGRTRDIYIYTYTGAQSAAFSAGTTREAARARRSRTESGAATFE